MGNSQVYPNERTRIFNRKGFPIAEFRANVERSLVIGGEGRAKFQYPSRKTDVVNEQVLQFGNWLLVESDTAPDWVGVIDTPREWSPRVVSVYAYTPERVFSWRRGPLEQKITGSAGAIFETLITKINQAEGTILRGGNIWRHGEQREETINPTQLNEDLERLWERSGEDYNWRPEIDSNGRLRVYGDWVKRLGQDTTALLHEGKGGGNIEFVGNVFTEDGDIYNDVLAYGDGMSWKSKPNFTVTNDNSAEKFGLRQTAVNFSGVTNVATLRTNGRASLNNTKNSIKGFHVNCINVGDTFDYVALGNTMTLRLENMGFSGALGYETTVRITGMVINSLEKNVIELSLEEVL